MTRYPLHPDLLTRRSLREPIRTGFGRGLLKAGERDGAVVALCADLTESTQMHLFKNAYPDRFIEVGVAEQNLVTVAAGMARLGKIPFVSSYSAFSPGRNWEQIKTTAALNDQPVKVVGSHAGLNVGPDGATHQMLEDIALMRVVPNMVVVCPGDSVEAEKATIALAQSATPAYLRLARDATPVFSTEASPFEIGRGYVIRRGNDVSLFGTGTMTAELLQAADILGDIGIDAEVVHLPTVKPLDEGTVLSSVGKTGVAVSAEEAQTAGGLGGALAELLSSRLPVRLTRLGVNDRFGQSGTPRELLDAYRLSARWLAEDIATAVRQ